LTTNELHLLLGQALVALLSDCELLSVALWQGDPGLGSGTLADDEDVSETCGELETGAVLDMDNVEVSGVLLAVNDDTDTTSVTSTGDHDLDTVVELDVVNNLAGLDVNLDGIKSVDVGVGVSDRASVVCDDDWHILEGGALALDLAQLELGLLSAQGNKLEASLNVVQETVVLVGLGNGQDIHETSRVREVGADLSVNKNLALAEDPLGLGVGEGILQAVADEDDQRQTLAELVGSSGWAGGKAASHLAEHPVRGCCQALQVLAGSTRPAQTQ